MFYDIFSTPSLNNSLADYQWTWIGQGLTCNAYTFSNQPAVQAFYRLELPAYTWTLAFDGANAYGQCNVPDGLSNAVAIAAGGYFSLALRINGTVLGWGDNTHGQTNIPAGLSNVISIAAGQYHGVAVLTNGVATNWGSYDNVTYYSVTNYTVGTRPPLSNVVAVAAAIDHDIALMSNGTVVAWGLTNAGGNYVPTNVVGVKAIGCGTENNVALRNNGTVVAWGNNLFNQTNVPAGLTNVVAIAVGAQHTLALLANGTVQAWGDGFDGDTNIPTGLSNVVAIAAGDSHNLALKTNGMVVAWGLNTSSQTNFPAGLSNVMAIAAGAAHSVALLNNGTVISWGNNSNGQTNVFGTLPTSLITTDPYVSPPSFSTNTYPPIVVKLIAAGGNHTMAAIFTPLVHYPINVSQDLLLIYNSNSIDSSNVCQYYLTHRPMISNANVLGIDCLANEQIDLVEYTNEIALPIQDWLAVNPTKRPSYVILFPDIPSRTDLYGPPDRGVQVNINTTGATGWQPFVTSINMNGTGGTNDCIAYIKKIVSMASNNPPGTLFISATAGHYGNTNWYFDDTGAGFGQLGWDADQGVLAANPSASVFYWSNTIITNGTNVAGYYSLGVHNGSFSNTYPVNRQIVFSGASEWYLIETDESFNGQRNSVATGQGSFLEWYASNAFGGSGYSCTPVGAVSHVEEPNSAVNNPYLYFGLWAQGNTFAYCAWNSFYGYGSPYLQAVGDPFVTK